jgi:hypothetical protein
MILEFSFSSLNCDAYLDDTTLYFLQCERHEKRRTSAKLGVSDQSFAVSSRCRCSANATMQYRHI